MSIIGEQIKKYRIQKKYTQGKFGKLTCITTQVVSKRERRGAPESEVFSLLADALYGREKQDVKYR